MSRIKNEHIHEMVIEKSRFITYLNRALNEEEAKTYIAQIKKMHPDATHHCTAYIFGEHDEFQKSSDDGEPSGTAGIPMLESLRKNNMQDIVAVVVRYFGGIKLGAGGLIRAYSKSVSTALSTATLMEKRKMKVYKCQFTYDLIGVLDYYFLKHSITILDKTYDEKVSYTYLTDQDIHQDLLELSKGTMINEFIEEKIIEVEL